MIVISDTSPIFNLAAVGQLHLLERLYGKVLVPSAVSRELASIAQRLTSIPPISALPWIEERRVANTPLVNLMGKAGFWLDGALYARVLREAGE